MRSLAPLALAAVAALALAACGLSEVSDDTCQRFVGQDHVVVDSVFQSGVRITRGDSVRVPSTVRHVEAARPVEVTTATVCEITYSDPIARPVAYAPSDTNVVAARAGGWLVGRAIGIAQLQITAANARGAEIPLEVVE